MTRLDKLYRAHQHFAQTNIDKNWPFFLLGWRFLNWSMYCRQEQYDCGKAIALMDQMDVVEL
jgi:hypothetical protein